MEGSTFAPATVYHHSFDPVAITVNAVVGLLFLVIWAFLRCCVYRQVLKESPDGPTDIHLETNLALDAQQRNFLANGGNAETKVAQKTEHQKNMAMIRKYIGAEQAAKLEKELDARGLELDGEAIERMKKQAGPEIFKTMVENRCGPEQAMKIVLKKQAAIALKKDPELEQKLKTDPELAKQALELGVINRKQLEQYQAEMAAANAATPDTSPTTNPEALPPAAAGGVAQ